MVYLKKFSGICKEKKNWLNKITNNISNLLDRENRKKTRIRSYKTFSST